MAASDVGFTVSVPINVGAAQAATAFRQMGEAAMGLNRQMDGFRNNFSKIFAFRELGRAGAAVAGFSSTVIKAAMMQQDALLALRNAANFTSEEMVKQDSIVTRMTAKHAMSFTDAANIQSIIAGQGVRLGNRGLAMDEGFSETVAKFADVMRLGRNPMQPVGSARLAIEVGEMFGARTGEAFEKVLGTFFKLSQTSTGSATELKGQMKFAAQLSKSLGVAPETFMSTIAALQSAGQTTGGRSMRSILLNALPGTAKHNEKLAALGLMSHGRSTLFGPDGTFDIGTMLETLSGKQATMGRAAFASAVGGAFNKEGTSAILTLSQPQVVQSIERYLKSLGTQTSMTEAQTREQANASFQLDVFETNLRNLKATMGAGGLLGAITKAAGATGQWANDLTTFLKAHPGLSGAAGIGLAGAGIGGLALEKGSQLAMFVAASKLAFPAMSAAVGSALGVSMAAIGSALAVVLPVVVIAAAIIAGASALGWLLKTGRDNLGTHPEPRVAPWDRHTGGDPFRSAKPWDRQSAQGPPWALAKDYWTLDLTLDLGEHTEKIKKSIRMDRHSRVTSMKHTAIRNGYGSHNGLEPNFTPAR